MRRAFGGLSDGLALSSVVKVSNVIRCLFSGSTLRRASSGIGVADEEDGCGVGEGFCCERVNGIFVEGDC